MHHSVSTSKLTDKQKLTTSTSQQQIKDARPQQQPSVSYIVCRTLKTRPGPTVMRMCPPATVRNYTFHKPLLAVGNKNGIIQIFNLTTGELYRELNVHAYAVRGIEWIGLNAFLSYAESESFQGSESNWELNVTELTTGRTVQLKNGKSKENSVILSVKASHLRQYFIIVYRSDPFEIWDLESLSLIRRVPKKFSGIVAAEWNPLYSKKVNQQQKLDETSSKISEPYTPLKENFVVTNKAGELFHFSIAGSVVKEISRIPPEATMTKAVTAIAWKSDHVILGRSDGSLSVWDLGKKESRTVSTMRGTIKRIRFAPGKGNMKILILYDDGSDIWDVKELRLVSTILRSSETSQLRVEDSDWGASDRPVILASDGSVIVSDIDFKQIAASHLSDPNYNRQSSATSSSAPTNTNKSDPCNLQ